PVLEYLAKVLMWPFLPDAAVLKSERSKALRNRSVSLHKQKSWFWGFLFVVLTRRFLLCAAVLWNNN
ncbi:hypothetical protein HMPREF9104_03023, partial [Lentilactobacillus kisonensis F0435]